MSSSRRFRATDLFEFNNVNLDVLTETYNISFYLSYLARWPDMFTTTISSQGQLMGYLMGKVEGREKDEHGHVTAVSVAPGYRRLNLARRMMRTLEAVSEDNYDAYFVDLFVRSSNTLAINMYKSFGYVVYRRVKEYYSSPSGVAEDGFDMRICLKRDTAQESIKGHSENNSIAAEDFPVYA